MTRLNTTPAQRQVDRFIDLDLDFDPKHQHI